MKNSRVIYILTVVLFLLYIFSFTNTVNRREVKTKSSLIGKNADVEKIKFSYKDESLSIEKCDKFWLCQLSSLGEIYSFPCNNEIINAFLEQSRNIQNMYKISNNNKKWGSLGLEENDAFKIEYFEKDNNRLTTLFFGNIPLSKSEIIFRNNKTLSSYKIDSRIIRFLNLDINFWADTNLIPVSVAGTLNSKNIQRIECGEYNKKEVLATGTQNFNLIADKLPSFRHGNVILSKNVNSDKNVLLSIFLEDGSSNSYNLSFTKEDTESENYIVMNKIILSAQATEKAKNAVSSFNTSSVISAWTFNQIKLLLGIN